MSHVLIHYWRLHHNDVTMGSMASQITNITILLGRLFGRRSKKTSKLRVTGLCAGNLPGTGEFPAQMASSAENVSIWWRHHISGVLHLSQFISSSEKCENVLEMHHFFIKGEAPGIEWQVLVRTGVGEHDGGRYRGANHVLCRIEYNWCFRKHRVQHYSWSTPQEVCTLFALCYISVPFLPVNFAYFPIRVTSLALKGNTPV